MWADGKKPQLTREGSLLRIVTLKHDPARCIDDTICGNWWVVGDLLNGERRQSTSVPVRPVTVEKPAARGHVSDT